MPASCTGSTKVTPRGGALCRSQDPTGRDPDVHWATNTHATRHTEITELFARPELAHTRRLRFTSPRQATAWLASLRP